MIHSSREKYKKQNLTWQLVQEKRHIIWCFNSSIYISFQMITFKMFAVCTMSCIRTSLKDIKLPSAIELAFKRLHLHVLLHCRAWYAQWTLWALSSEVLMYICPMQCFFLAPTMMSYFAFRIFLVNCGSYKYSSSGSFYVLPMRNLALQSLGDTCIVNRCLCIKWKQFYVHNFQFLYFSCGIFYTCHPLPLKL